MDFVHFLFYFTYKLQFPLLLISHFLSQLLNSLLLPFPNHSSYVSIQIVQHLPREWTAYQVEAGQISSPCKF